MAPRNPALPAFWLILILLRLEIPLIRAVGHDVSEACTCPGPVLGCEFLVPDKQTSQHTGEAGVVLCSRGSVTRSSVPDEGKEQPVLRKDSLSIGC